MLKFKERLVELRKEHGMTQDDLAHKLGMTRSAICNYEKGIREPSFEILEVVADIFNVSISDLLDESEASRLVMLYAGRGQELVDAFYALNEEGQNKLIEYANLLVSSGSYKKRGSDSVVSA